MHCKKKEQNVIENPKILVTNIQRFSLHDGPGIRTTVFLKGCSLRCPWCSNPENLIRKEQTFIKNGIESTYGKYYCPSEILAEVLKDRMYYSGEIPQEEWSINNGDLIKSLPGGVTFSGGEALLQIRALIPVIEKLKMEKVHTAVETCLFIPHFNMKIAIDYIDLFYVDMKILDERKCKEIEKGLLPLYLQNLNILMKCGKPVVIRVPVIGGYTENITNRIAVKKLIEKYIKNGNGPLKVELIKGHNLGEDKYRSLNLPIPVYLSVSEEVMESYMTELEHLGIPIEVCQI